MWHQCKHGTFSPAGSPGFKVQTPRLRQDGNFHVCLLSHISLVTVSLIKATVRDAFSKKEQPVVKEVLNLMSVVRCFEWCSVSSVTLIPLDTLYFWIREDSQPDSTCNCVSGVCIKPEWNVWPSVSPDVCGRWNKTSVLWMTHTHLCCGLQGL